MATYSSALRFDLVDLRLFVNILERGSLTRGAESSALSPAAASARIKHLEEALGAPLLYRTRRGVQHTPAGEALLHHARAVLSQLRLLGDDLQQYAEGVKGHIRIYANTTAVSEFLPAILGAFLALNPTVNIELREHGSPDIVRAVHEGKADIGIVASYASTTGLQTLPYREDRMMLAVSKRHQLARRRRIRFVEVLDLDFVALDPRHAVQSFVDNIVRDLGRNLTVRIQVGSFDAMCRMIETNVGIGVLPESAARRHQQLMDFHIIELEDSWSIQPLQICVRDLRGLPAFARRLVELLVADASGKPVRPRRRA
jgi:DNA-binding transcriptional LysR family regulator